MAIILIHSSKTMRSGDCGSALPQVPILLEKATQLATYVSGLRPKQLEKSMQLSPLLAEKTHSLMSRWGTDHLELTPAIDSFIGDIYSGLQVASLTSQQRKYANEHVSILSGLYGVVRPLDGISPYRLEMGYRFNDEPFKNLYSFWGKDIAQALPTDTLVVNLSAVEYTKAVLPYLEDRIVVSPKFLTKDPQTKQPKFVVVHAKIARGAFARWMIVNNIDLKQQLSGFTDLNYQYDASLSSEHEPVFVCDTFGGLGLSVRLTKQ